MRYAIYNSVNLPGGVAFRTCAVCLSLLAAAMPNRSYAEDEGFKSAPEVSSARWDTLLLAKDGSVFGCGTEPDYVAGDSGYPVLQAPAGTATWISAGRYHGYYNGVLIGNVSATIDPPASQRPTAGFDATFYVGDDRLVYAAGLNHFGQLGDPAIPFSPTTGEAPDYPSYGTVKRFDGSPLRGIVSVAAGSSVAAAVDRHGRVWTWGHNGYGELGDGTLTDRGYAKRVRGLEDVVSVAASTGRYLDAPYENGLGGIGSPLHDHLLALTEDGEVWGWGENRDGELGNGTTGIQVTDPFKDRAPALRPVQALIGPGRPLTRVVAIAVGGAHSIALREDGTVWTWGYNGSGQLGDGAFYEGIQTVNGQPVNSFARQVPGLSRIRAIAAGPAQSFAVDASGAVYSWGWNDASHGTLCLGAAGGNVPSPQQVTNADGSSFSLGR